MLAAEYNYQNWDAIAEELNNNRSGFSVCIHYYSKLSDTFRKDRFLPEEDEFLMEVINICRIGSFIPWSKVAYYFQHRSRHQLYHRYKYYLSVQKDILKTPFTVEEDVLIALLVHKMGKDFQKIAKHVPNRSGMQIKNRYNCYLQNFNIKYGPWTYDEDQKILEHSAVYGVKKWGKLADEINRSRGGVRHRYWNLVAWINRNPNKSVSEIPRRKNTLQLKCTTNNQKLTEMLINKFKKLSAVPTLNTIAKEADKRRNVARKLTAKDEVHKELVDYFKKKYTEPAKKCPGFADNVRRNAAVVYDVIQLLNANLQIPDATELLHNADLNETDVSLLKLVKEKQIAAARKKPDVKPVSLAPSDENIKYSLPPSEETITGLRTLILKNSTAKTAPQPDEPDGDTPEQKLFEDRLHAVFKWPSIMSLTAPPNIFDVVNLKNVEGTAEKKAGRPTNFVKKKLGNVEKMVQARRAANQFKFPWVEQQKQEAPRSGIRVKSLAQLVDSPQKNATVKEKNKQTLQISVKENHAKPRKSAAKTKFVMENVIHTSGEKKPVFVQDISKILPDHVKRSIRLAAMAKRKKNQIEKTNATDVKVDLFEIEPGPPQQGSNLINFGASTSANDDESFGCNVRNRCFQTYSRKRKNECDLANGQPVKKECKPVTKFEVEEDIMCLQDDISLLDDIIASNKQIS